MVDNVVVKRPLLSNKTKTGRRRNLQHLCLDKAYNSEPKEQELIKRGYVLHIPPKRTRGEEKEEEAKVITQHCSVQERYFVYYYCTFFLFFLENQQTIVSPFYLYNNVHVYLIYMIIRQPPPTKPKHI